MIQHQHTRKYRCEHGYPEECHPPPTRPRLTVWDNYPSGPPVTAHHIILDEPHASPVEKHSALIAEHRRSGSQTERPAVASVATPAQAGTSAPGWVPAPNPGTPFAAWWILAALILAVSALIAATRSGRWILSIGYSVLRSLGRAFVRFCDFAMILARMVWTSFRTRRVPRLRRASDPSIRVVPAHVRRRRSPRQVYNVGRVSR